MMSTELEPEKLRPKIVKVVVINLFPNKMENSQFESFIDLCPLIIRLFLKFVMFFDKIFGHHPDWSLENDLEKAESFFWIVIFRVVFAIPP